MNNTYLKQFPIITVQIGDMSVESVLDTGFIHEYEFTPFIHSHSYYELFAVFSGTLGIETPSGVQITVANGSICLIPPDYYHRTFSAMENCVKLAIRFHITPKQAAESELIYKTCTDILSLLYSPVLLKDCHILCDLLKSIREELNNNQLASRTLVSVYLSDFYIKTFRYLSEVQAEPVTLPDDAILKNEYHRLQIDEYFNLHHSEAITEEDFSQYFNLSKRQLNRILQNIYGMSFREILVHKRMQEAIHLLVNTDYSIEAIANIVGYTSLSGFYTAFQKKFNISAGQYRKQYTMQSQTSENKTSCD